MRRAAQSGMSLIEVMIAVAIVIMVLAAGMPTYTIWIQNTQIRVAGEAIMNGLQTARNEAIKQNAARSMQLTVLPTSTWVVNDWNTPDLAPPLFGRSSEEGSQNATVVVTPGGADTVSFNSLGRVIANNDGSPSMTRIDIDNPKITSAADKRMLRIIVPLGGAIHMCDPKVTAANDPRICPP